MQILHHALLCTFYVSLISWRSHTQRLDLWNEKKNLNWWINEWKTATTGFVKSCSWQSFWIVFGRMMPLALVHFSIYSKRSACPLFMSSNEGPLPSLKALWWSVWLRSSIVLVPVAASAVLYSSHMVCLGHKRAQSILVVVFAFPQSML